MRQSAKFMAGLALVAVVPLAAAQPAVGSAFGFQGYLVDSGSPANGAYDFVFDLYNAPTGGATVAATVTADDVTVSNGLFTVSLDFGATVFNDYARWLQIGVRPGSSTGAYNTLLPRQRIRPTPYSLATRGLDVNSAGYCGINKASPLAPLHVQGSTDLGLTSSDYYHDEKVMVEGSHSWLGLHSDNSANPGSGIVMAENDSGTNNFWWLYRSNTASGGNLQLSYGTSPFPTSSGNTSVMQFTPDGNVGIGSSPSSQARLQVEADSYTCTIPVALRVLTNYRTGFDCSGTISRFLDLKGAQILAVDNDAAQYTTLELNPISGGVSIGRTDLRGNAVLSIAHANISESGGSGDIYSLSDVSVEDTDAWLSLLSANAGTDGSGIELVESEGDKWAIYRHASTSDRALVFANSSGSDPTDPNDIKMEILPDGTTRVKVLEITGADVAERFPVSDQIEPGMVVEIDPDHAGQLRLASGAYNRRVAGVVSGAGDIPAGAILGNLKGSETAPPIALSGRVWVHCNASSGAIEPGDLLTTAVLPGYAMKVTDYPRAQGAIIGKAMSSLKEGTGLVLVLVNLQ